MERPRLSMPSAEKFDDESIVIMKVSHGLVLSLLLNVSSQPVKNKATLED
jgi:hypothetical protein